jgi:histidinol dehydrogenase
MQIINFENLTADFYTYQEFEGIHSVCQIIQDVKNRGDKAVIEYSQKFGDGSISALELTEKEIEAAINLVPDDVIDAIKTSIANVKAFAQKQFLSINNIEMNLNGAILGHTIVPLEITGAYVPGGNYPLPSSAIMSVVPAKVAGVKEVIVCSPKIKPETIAAAKLSGADRIFRVGGVQAIAAMAYGTQSIPKVDKITGPGNKYVTTAKKEVYGVCGIDFLAGPSEVMIIADETANAEFIAADMLAQCEHDLDARAYLVTNSTELVEKVQKNIEIFLPNLKTAEIAAKSIEKSIAIIVKDMKDSIEIANKKAPEHLEICFAQAEEWMPKFTNYGSLFIGNYSAEVIGDYCSGTNHVLPTNGVARYSGGLSVFDFIKIQTFQEVSKDSNLFAVASKIAETEGLMAHKLSADLRISNS